VTDYGVNINLRVKGQSGLDRLNAKVKEITKSIDNIRGIDIMNPRNTGGAGGKGARKTIKQYRQDMEELVKTVNKSKGAFGKTANQQMAAADALQEYANNLKLGTKAQKAASTAAAKQIRNIDLETTAIMENTKMKKKNIDLQNRMGGGFGRGGFGGENPKGNRAALTSGLISGAFPLLFGQGIPGGAAGFAGGFIGTKAGGKMGGFAGGLVATAVLQQITTFFEGINTLAGAFSELNPNIEQATVALGLNGTAEAERIKLIEKSQGKMVALALVTERMNEAIGANGVKNLKEFSEATRSLGNSFKLAMTKMQAALAPLFTFLAKAAGKVTGSQAAETDRLANIGGAKTDSILKDLEAELAGVGTGSSRGRKGREMSKKKADIQARIDARKKELADVGEVLEKEQLRAAQYDEITRSVEKQNQFLNEAITLGGREAEIQEKLREFDRKALEFDKEIDKEERKQYENALRLQEELKRIDALYSGIADTVQSGLVDAIDGAITGTMTLGEVASSVFGSIRRQLIDFGATSLLRAIPGIGGFFADGGVTKPNKSYIVGERGPELFTPGVTGRVTPNHEMGGGSTNVVVNVDASGSNVEGDQQQGRELGRVIAASVQSELIRQKRPGGLLA